MPKGVSKGARRITVQHRKFAVAYATSADRYQAYAAAGGKGTRHAVWAVTNRWLKRDDVQKLIASVETKVEEKAIAQAVISTAWVDQGLVEIVTRSMQKEAVFDHDGQHTGEWKYDAQAALRGLELCAKRLGLLTEKTLTGDLDKALENMTEAQLQDRRRSLMAEFGPAELRRALAEMEGHGAQGANPGTGGEAQTEADGLPALSEAAGVPPSRLN